MGRLRFLGILLFFAAAGPPVAAEDFPKNLAFLAKLPVVIRGACLGDVHGAGSLGTCEVRVEPVARGGYVFHLTAEEGGELLPGVQTFILSRTPVDLPILAEPVRMHVVMRGTCSGQELGLGAPAPCEFVVVSVPRHGEAVYLRVFRGSALLPPAPAHVDYFTLTSTGLTFGEP